MDALHTFIRQLRTLDLKQNGIAFGMLGIALFALYSGLLMFAIIPLLWMGYRIGKEMGRQEAQNEVTHADLAAFPERSSHLR